MTFANKETIPSALLKEMNIGKRYFILIEYVFENNLARWTARIMTKKG
jgi:hypothetical protein